jgi:biotin-(acetyl-CoA carboxylase) ligase
MSAIEEVGGAIAALICKSKAATGIALITLASVAEQLLMLVGIGLATDISRWKNAKLRKTEAEADKAEAEAKKLNAESLKTLAEAASIANEAQAARSMTPPAVRDATDELQRALSVLAQHGGGIHVDVDELARLIDPRQSANPVELKGTGGVEAGVGTQSSIPETVSSDADAQ